MGDYSESFQKNTDLIDKFNNISKPNSIKEIIDGNLEKIKEFSQSGFLGFGKETAYKNAVEVYDESVGALETYNEKIIEYHYKILEIRQEISYELYNFSTNILLLIYGFFNEDKDIEIIYELCDLEECNFDTNLLLDTTDFERVQDLGLSERLNKALDTVAKYSERELQQSDDDLFLDTPSNINRENKTNKTLMKAELTLQAIDAIGSHIENVERINQAFSKMIKSYQQIIHNFEKIYTYEQDYTEKLNILKKAYMSYQSMKTDILKPKIDVLFSTKVFEEYIEAVSDTREKYISSKEILKSLEDTTIKEPSLINNIFSFGKAQERYRLEKEEHKKDIETIKNTIATLTTELKAIEEWFLPLLYETEEFISYNKNINDFYDILKLIRDNANKELNFKARSI